MVVRDFFFLVFLAKFMPEETEDGGEDAFIRRQPERVHTNTMDSELY